MTNNSVDNNLGLYTAFTFVSCCCCGSIPGAILCFLCSNKIKQCDEAGDMEGVEKYKKYFWICFVGAIVLNMVVTAVTGAATTLMETLR